VSGAVRGRYSRSSPCPICSDDPTRQSGKGERCYGFLSTDGRWAFCTREEHAGEITFNVGANAYGHALAGACHCGLAHGFRAAQGRATLKASPPKVPKEDHQQLDADMLHAVNSAYLSLLPLRREHASYYVSRGPADLAVARSLSYGSLPLGYTAARQVVDTLVARFGPKIMELVPGFYAGKDGRLLTHTARATEDAAVIPMRDEQGRIIGMIRHYIVGSKPKYMMFAGGTNDSYTVAGSWPVGAVRQIAITEGPHKAHVAAHYSAGIVIMGLMGTALRATHLAGVERLRPDLVMEALDADKFTNVAVEKARAKMHASLLGSAKLAQAQVHIVTAIWDAANGKGLDDLLASGRLPKLRSIPWRAAVTTRKPIAIPEPGRVPPGRPLAEVQAETEGVIDAFVRDRRTKHGRVKLVQVPPGVGKTTAVAKAIIRNGVAARILVSTSAKAAEIEAAHSRIRAVEGRNATNCGLIELVEAARTKGHDVAELICQRCPLKPDCVVMGYYHQFKNPGPLVGPVEFLFSGEFLRRGELVVLDDPSLERAMIDTRTIRSDGALRLASAVPAGPTRDLLVVIQRAIDTLKETASFAPPLIGPAAWDSLARAAGGSDILVELVRATPDERDILPAPGDDGVLTVEDIERAPDAVLAKLVRLLKGEVDDFAGSREFNSGLSIHPGGLELRALRQMLADKDMRPLIANKAVLILDATPILPLYQRLSDGLVMEPIFAPEVILPPNVSVTQVADRFGGKTSVERQAMDGRRPGQDALLASLAKQRQRYPGDREAAICAKSLKDEVVAAGINEARTLTFYGSRGLNSIEDADVLHVLGRPQAPDYSALQLAHVLHKGEAPILPHMGMRSEPYAGYRAADETGRAITVSDFWDKRASVLFRAFREAELLQAVHRARLFRVGSAQMELFATDGQRIARTASERRHVRLVIHSAHPIPGLRVDELIYSEDAGVNEQRAVEAAERILAAAAQLVAEGAPVTVEAVARVTGSRKPAIIRVLADQEFDPAPERPLVSTTTTRGRSGAGSNIPPASDERPPDTVPHPFAPSPAWQPIPDGYPCPPGGEFRMNFQTGENLGRWPDLTEAAG